MPQLRSWSCSCSGSLAGTHLHNLITFNNNKNTRHTHTHTQDVQRFALISDRVTLDPPLRPLLPARHASCQAMRYSERKSQVSGVAKGGFVARGMEK